MSKLEFMFWRWMHAWVTLAVGLVSTISLGFIWTGWDFSLIAWITKRQMLLAKKKR